MRTPSLLPVILSALLLPAGLTTAQEALPADVPSTQPAEQAEPAATQPAFEGLVVREHAQEELQYRSVVGLQPLKDDAGTTRGSLFFTYYARLGEDGRPLHETQPDRPITYVFNGGPGAASVWLHLGTAGPYRVPVGPEGQFPAPPYEAVPNEATWLDATDLCFIDPIGTGFSRPEGKDTKANELFYGVRQDVQWVAEFVRLHVTRFGRWDDPKFLAGESYGTTRAAQLASYLHDRFGLDVNGVILISTVLDFATIRTAENNLLPYVVFLPTYAAAAVHHGKVEIEGELAEHLEKVQAFATEEYLPALMAGGLLSEEEKRKVAREYARYTGLPVDYVLASDLRVDPARFMKQLLNEERQIIGRMDARIAAPDLDPVDDTPSRDPSLGGYVGVYAGAFNDYVRQDLGYESDAPYEVLSGRVHPWQGAPETTGSYTGGYLNVSDELREALLEVPSMRLLVASGFYDLATPYYGADYTVAQMNLPPQVRDRVTQAYYAGGHMMYHVADERAALEDDIEAFIEAAVTTTQPAE